MVYLVYNLSYTGWNKTIRIPKSKTGNLLAQICIYLDGEILHALTACNNPITLLSISTAIKQQPLARTFLISI